MSAKTSLNMLGRSTPSEPVVMQPHKQQPFPPSMDNPFGKLAFSVPNMARAANVRPAAKLTPSIIQIGRAHV